ncbi:hypothetical protein [Cellulomonas marina]|uniref:hypothetical protein n=1 Tax=Cellulomonas marina TaxID=988821 RepID=UPI0011139174|nr:hypothetical protein [Cellulomonas marina]GIG29693.1 hypothetical protein Cma02nite_22930 [Cellulomonas marina]
MGRRAARWVTAGPSGLVAIAVCLTCAGCGGPDGDDAVHVALQLETALAAGQGPEACALLLPAAAEAVADRTGNSCDGGVVDLVGVSGADPAAAATTTAPRVAVAGRQAQVALSGDTVFLARDGEGWVVTAALCAARADRPYDCEVEAS